MFGEGRKWTREQYAVTLPLLYTYNRANALELTEFFTALPEYVQTSDLEMEKAFVERFCKEEIAHMAAHIGVRQQKQNESNEQFLRSVLRDHKYMMRWRPDNTIPVEFVIRSFETRFVKPKMVEYVFDAFFEARINGTQVTFSSLVAMAEKADRHDGRMHSIENTGYLNDGLPVRVARVGHQTEEHKPMQESIESCVRHVVRDSAGSYEDELEIRVLNVNISELILEARGAPTDQMVRQVRKKMERSNKRPRPVHECTRDEMKNKDFIATFGKLHNGVRCEQDHICAFYGTHGHCTAQPGLCAHKHERRLPQMCAVVGCSSEAFCKHRHKGDQYQVWFYDRKRLIFKCYLWKDRTSSFSVHRSN
jgi:hypothetical protein